MTEFRPRIIRPAAASLSILIGVALASKAGVLNPTSALLPTIAMAAFAAVLGLPKPAGSGGLALTASATLAWGFGVGSAALALGTGLLLGSLADVRNRRLHALHSDGSIAERSQEILRLLASSVGGACVLQLSGLESLGVGLSSLWVAGLAIALSPPPWTDGLRRAAIETTAWVAGLALGRAYALHGWALVLPLLLLIALLALLTYFEHLAREAAEERSDTLTDMSRASERVIADGDHLDLVAEQIRVECRKVLPFTWFELEVPGERTWHTGPDGRFEIGPARPGPAPTPLPGIHRRPQWRTLERTLVTDGVQVASLRLWCDPRRLRRPPGELLDSLLPQMAASLKRVQLDRRANRDDLTGLPMRHVLDTRLEKAFTLSRQGGASLAVILCDIDHFKRINDTWGHATGDLALIRVAELLESLRREEDLFCRWGGEEFALLLESTDGEKALHIADRIRQTVQDTELEVQGQRISITLSAGVATFPELCAQSGQELFSLADAALYEAKHQGRNRCLLYRGPGRYVDARGTQILGENLSPPSEAPRFFA